MPAFNDGGGHDWVIRFDGVTLAELRDAHGIDLADITGESYLALESDQTALTKAVMFLCREQMDKEQVAAKQFANLLTGEAAEAAMQAIWGAAKVFFRPKLWSALDCAYKMRKQTAEQWAQIAPAMELLNRPELPDAMRAAVMEQLATKMDALGSSQKSTDSQSATGPAATPSTPATDSPVPAESTPAA